MHWRSPPLAPSSSRRRRAAGLPRTVYGRAIVQKVLLMGSAVFFVTNQCPNGLSHLVREWSRQMWDLLWSTSTGDAREAAGADRGRPPSLVRHATTVQDYADGGARALHVERFFHALRISWVLRVLDPMPSIWKNLFWSLGFRGTRPSERRAGEHLLLSGADLSAASLEGANLEGTKLTGALAEGTAFSQTILDAGDLTGADFTDAVIQPYVQKGLCGRKDVTGATRDSLFCP